MPEPAIASATNQSKHHLSRHDSRCAAPVLFLATNPILVKMAANYGYRTAAQLDNLCLLTPYPIHS